MATTINKLVYNLRKLIKDSRSDDIKFTDRNLEFIINYIRVKVIRQDVQKTNTPSPSYIQNIPKVELDIINSSRLNELPTGKFILKSKRRLPDILDYNGYPLVTSLTGLDGYENIDFKSKANATMSLNSKYAKNITSAYYEDGYLYIVNCKNFDLRYVSLSGVFEDPRQLSEFKGADGKSPCYNPDVDSYPVSAHMIDMINNIIKRQELDLYFQILEDRDSDGRASD